jgi:hypothetical protein
MNRVFARTPRGQWVHDAVPGGHRNMLHILGAMSHTGMLAVMTVEAVTDREVCLAYLDQVLFLGEVSRLRPGHMVLTDTVSAHKVAGVGERIDQTGGALLYLPPYSPDLNPIEKAWSKLKENSEPHWSAPSRLSTKPSDISWRANSN